MPEGVSRIFFDRRDHALLNIVNEVLNKGESFTYLKNLLYPYLHPRGIKEMAATRGLRIAYAAVRLLESLEIGKADDRLSALRSLRDEVMTSAASHLQKNTARVLLEIMKELVRTRDNELRQLELAHDFRTAASGKPRIVRALLRRYHLLEMPEEWNQAAFDGHVHDSHTKGRKSPSHLIMDAWIKGIRNLTVIYYNYVRPGAAAELVEAADIMGITVRIGVEFSVRFHNQYVQLIWVPRGFSDPQDFLSFLSDPRVEAFMEEGHQVSEYQQGYVMAVLQEFNNRHRIDLNEACLLELAPLDSQEFLDFVGPGQASILHLGKFIHSHLLPALQPRIDELKECYDAADLDERDEIINTLEQLTALDSEMIVERYLRPAQNPGVPDPNVPREGPGIPSLLKLSPQVLLERVGRLHTGCRITLNLSNLQPEDVLELLYDCKGAISQLEIFNLKDFVHGRDAHYSEINELQQYINEGNVIALKRYIREIIQRLEAAENGGGARIAKLKEILHNIATLRSYYRKAPLGARIGSDSTGHSYRLHGMGLAIIDTLPYRARSELHNSNGVPRMTLPVHIDAYLRDTCIPQDDSELGWSWLSRLMCRVPGLRGFSREHRKEWVVQDSSTRIVDPGNIVALGGVHEERDRALRFLTPRPKVTGRGRRWNYLNSSLKNSIKVLIGFGPAFATFYFSKDWWILAYFGAFIWFGITWLRNIAQAVLGAGGIRRSPLLRWNDYVNWARVSDSLLYTGLSVPLLDYLVKTVILDRSFGVNTATNPVVLYAVMSLVNALYISSHNAWRGLQRAVICGNLFRSVLSIPLAVAFNTVIGMGLAGFGVVDVTGVLQRWAAIISKAASDCVAGVIEGMADRHTNVLMRRDDYAVKLAQLFDAYTRLELLFPEADVIEMLESPEKLISTISTEARDLVKIIMVNALDLLYFWMYQPRARSVLKTLLRRMSQEERQVLLHSQSVLLRTREVGQLFIDGIVGRQFARALSFYLDRSREYMEALEKVVEAVPPYRGQSYRRTTLQRSVEL